MNDILNHISHSSLSALSVSPQYFLKYKRRELDKDSKAFDLGSAIHCYMFEFTEFNNRYVVSHSNPVGGMMGVFIESYVEAEDTMINEHMPKEMKLDGYQTLHELCYDKAGFKTALETVLKKFNSDENQAYYKFLKENLGKTVLSQDDMNTVMACHSSILKHEKANSLIFPGEGDRKPEFEISWIYKEIDVKSIIDNLILDVENKKVYIVDLKTSSKSVYNFERSYFSYNYYRQMAIYRLAVHSYLKKLGIDTKEYDILSYIVVVQTTGLHECVVYKPDLADLSIGLDQFDELVNRYKWHVDNNQWDFPMEYYKNDGVVNLKLSDEFISRIEENKG
tara:strand:+ start:1206 stop:2213 length:1008 start_codon:yes stop_codon:yes gene_type:complete